MRAEQRSARLPAMSATDDSVLKLRLLAKEVNLRSLTKKYLAFAAAMHATYSSHVRGGGARDARDAAPRAPGGGEGEGEAAVIGRALVELMLGGGFAADARLFSRMPTTATQTLKPRQAPRHVDLSSLRA